MLAAPGVPPHQLDLKVNCICAIQQNLSVEKGLVRNVRVRVTALHRCFVKVQLLNNLEHHCIPRITFSFRPICSSWTVNRKQFPLRLAYATTFNGCQGLTLSCTVLDLRTDVFAHSQIYTSLSHVKRREDTLCLFADGNENSDCVNIVYKSLLL
ncbi:hypothetical protein P692DRAFT_20740374 [Suillus brevipes Sb2]|nr:hypothetical protein P692DRAFT_20740374 [Suillus brevipes Sb2]